MKQKNLNDMLLAHEKIALRRRRSLAFNALMALAFIAWLCIAGMILDINLY